MPRFGRRALMTGLALAVLVGCGPATDWIPGLSPYRAPSGGKTTMLKFDTPSMPFDNPAKKEQTGFAPGNWQVLDGALQQTQGATDNLANHVRYIGDAFNNGDGQAGIGYSVNVDCSVAKEADSPSVHGYPTGVLALMPYYKDPTHYVMLVAAKQDLSCWVVDGLRPAGDEWPQSAMVWDQWLSEPLDASSSIRLGAEIDADAHTLKILINDQPKGTRTISMITRDPHWIALGANGNYARYRNLKIVWTR